MRPGDLGHRRRGHAPSDQDPVCATIARAGVLAKAHNRRIYRDAHRPPPRTIASRPTLRIRPRRLGQHLPGVWSAAAVSARTAAVLARRSRHRPRPLRTGPRLVGPGLDPALVPLSGRQQETAPPVVESACGQLGPHCVNRGFGTSGGAGTFGASVAVPASPAASRRSRSGAAEAWWPRQWPRHSPGRCPDACSAILIATSRPRRATQ